MITEPFSSRQASDCFFSKKTQSIELQPNDLLISAKSIGQTFCPDKKFIQKIPPIFFIPSKLSGHLRAEGQI